MPWQAELPLGSERPLAADETPRTIALGDRIVPYVLRRTRRRTIALSIDHRGLRVGTPTRASLGEVEALILQHSAWVAKKLCPHQPGAMGNPSKWATVGAKSSCVCRVYLSSGGSGWPLRRQNGIRV